MRVYLDVCCLQRPLDDRSQPRVNVEAEAVLTILRLVEAGELELVSSEALEFEVERTPDPERRAAALEILKLASRTLRVTEELEPEARALIESGFQPLDALHLVLASSDKVEYFGTCDDKLRKRARRLKTLNLNVVTPLELAAEVMP